MECPKCGHINPDTAINCEKCRINLEWAREHREELEKRQRLDERPRIEVQKRKEPSIPGHQGTVKVRKRIFGIQRRREPFIPGHVFVWVGVMMFFMAFAYGGLTSDDGVITSDETPLAIWLLGGPFALVGIPLLITILGAVTTFNTFVRSSMTVQAKVLDRHAKTHVSPYHTDVVYKVTVRFDTVPSGATVEQVTLEAKVSKELYDRLDSGTEVTVRYATEDPSIALFEGEAGFDSSSTVPPTPP